MKTRERRSSEDDIKGLFNSESAAATVIGAVLLLSIIFTIFAVVRIAYVPEWKNDAEQLHMSEVQRDMMELKSTVDTIALLMDSNTSYLAHPYPVTIPFSMGGGEIPILEPSKSSGTLSVNIDDFAMNITANDLDNNQINSTLIQGHITYYSNNRQYIDQNLIYENGAFILDQGGRSIMKQSPSISITHNSGQYNIIIPAINLTGNSDTVSSDNDASLSLMGVGVSNSSDGQYISSLNCTINTKYPDAWESFLNETAQNARLVYNEDYDLKTSTFNNITNSDVYFNITTTNGKLCKLYTIKSDIKAELGIGSSFNIRKSTNSEPVTITDPQPKTPVAKFSSHVTTGYSPLVVQFMDQSENNATAWNWDFGDGNISTDRNPRYIYSSIKDYTVTLKVSNAAGNDTCLNNIYVKARPELIKPTANFSATPSSGYVPLTVTFADQSTGSPTSWYWILKDGVHSPAQNIEYKYNKAGTYNVSMTVTNVNGTDSKSAIINVMKATPTITWSKPADIIYGTALNSTQLNATASVNGTFVYTPASGTTLSAGTQTLYVDFTPADTANYNITSKDVTINVMKATPTITWNSPAGIIYGKALNSNQLNATASVNGTFVYTPASGTALSAGTQTLHVDFTPADTANYNITSKDVTINVLKATPAITWNSPPDMIYGTSLNSTQLNATASVNGTFVYTPASGTALSAGTQTLHVDFTPADTANYNIASKDVTINVMKATPTITWSSPLA